MQRCHCGRLKPQLHSSPSCALPCPSSRPPIRHVQHSYPCVRTEIDPHYSVPNPPSHVSALWGDAAASASCVRRHSTPSNKRPRLSNSSWQSTTCGKHKLHNVQNVRRTYLVERHERARLLQLHYELAYLHRSPLLENLLELPTQQGGAWHPVALRKTDQGRCLHLGYLE